MMADGALLVIRLSALGDVLFTLPAIHALKQARPDLAIDWVVEERAAALLDLYPPLRRRISWRRAELVGDARRPHRWPHALAALAGHVAAVRREHYDAVLDFQGNLKSGAHALLARGRRKIGLARGISREGSWLAARERITPPPTALHRVEQALALVRAFAPEIPEVATAPPLVIPDAAAQFAARELGALGLAQAPFTILHPGTSAFGAFKRWRPDRFALLADLLFKRHDVPSLVTFGPGEEELAAKVVASSHHGAARLAPKTRSLTELAALLARAKVVVASDSAALHLAAFLGTPVVALFGPKDPRLYGPRFAPMRVVHTWLPCSPCARRTCPDVLCMEEIGVRQVFEGAVQLIRGLPAVAIAGGAVR
ncbi:MAG: lipopolysaccharide heptosyltransferase family protein [Planctomycetes bacterium]|nr:lipopolysaccharide heptosyltransferase family protein [Planctomycetota bacterium]